MGVFLGNVSIIIIKKNDFHLGLFFIFYVNAEEYVIRYRKPHCSTCHNGGELTFTEFDTKEDVEKWLDLNRDIKASVFLLKPVPMEFLKTDEIKMVEKIVPEHVYKRKIKEL
jgi:hypothetical protein